MDRRAAILKFISREHRGIEIGPWMNPLAPKREGYNCLSLDVFDTVTLRKRASEDELVAHLVERIEEVDLVGSVTHIDELIAARDELGKFDYILSSHNFEHIPNPIRFLQACARVLGPGGLVSMAIPDKRRCFDYFRPVTQLSEWIQAFLEGRDKPTFAQRFDSSSQPAYWNDNGKPTHSFMQGTPSDDILSSFALEDAFNTWMESWRIKDEEYHDAHCSVFTPSSFELLIRDCIYLGLIPFDVIEIVETPSNEFYVHLRVLPLKIRLPNYPQRRNALLHQIHNDESETFLILNENTDKEPETSTLKLTLRKVACRGLAAPLRLGYRFLRRVARWKMGAPLRWGYRLLRKVARWKIGAPLRWTHRLLRSLI